MPKIQINKLLEKKKQLDNKIASIKAKERKEEEKKNTRRKILVGSYFIEKYKSNFTELTTMMDAFLNRDYDRALFNLPLKNQTNSDEKGNNK